MARAWMDSSLTRAHVVQAWITLTEASRKSRDRSSTEQEVQHDDQRP